MPGALIKHDHKSSDREFLMAMDFEGNSWRSKVFEFSYTSSLEAFFHPKDAQLPSSTRETDRTQALTPERLEFKSQLPHSLGV